MDKNQEFPRELDAKPGDSQDGYNFAFLRSAGYMDDCTENSVTYVPDSEVTFLFSLEGSVRIGYFEFPIDSVPRETPKKIVQVLRRQTRLQYFWFYDPDSHRVQVFRASRGNFQFIYNPTLHTGPTAESKLDKLEGARKDINALFDYKDVVDQFYRELWDYRSDLASALSTKSGHTLTKKEELLTAQRVIDRLIFLYFLVERGIVIPVNDSKEMVAGDTRELFSILVEEHEDFWELLHNIFFDRLNSHQNDSLNFTGSYWLHIPYLNGGLFQSDDLETVDGTVLDEEEELVIEDFDWDALISELNEYNWLLDGLDSTDSDESDTIGNLTPAVLGYIYEKFVISVSKVGDDVRLSDLDASHRNELLSEGNSEVGAYYTGEDITDFKSRRGLWEALLNRIESDISDGEIPASLDPSDLYRPGDEKREDIERDQRDGFSVLYEEYSEDPEVLEYIDSKLQDLKVCDPAIGSGSFGLAVANTLFEWRSMCVPTVDEYTLRREIIAQNIFGVDILEGATEICKLRLWLWLISATPVETTGPVEEREEIPPLPDITFNIRSANSLIGFTESQALIGKQQTISSATMEERLLDYGQDVRAHRESADPEQETKRELENRHAELKEDIDRWYAGAQSDPQTNSRLEIEDYVDTPIEASKSLEVGPESSTTLSVNIPDGIPTTLDNYLDSLGFTTFKYKARLDEPSLGRQGVGEIFDRLTECFEDSEDWEVIIEREYTGMDFDDDKLKACHWPLEFPLVFLEQGGFDLVISNPPYGASIAPEEEPLLKTEGNYTCQGTSDSCEWFYERALDLVHANGVISYIVSKSIAFYSSWSDIRGKLLEETAVRHVFDVGLGFVGVNLETIAMVHTLGNPAEGNTPTIHRSRDLRRTTANQPVHLGWARQRFMRDSETIIFRPITEEQSQVLDTLLGHDRRLGDVMSTNNTTRQLYIPDSTKKTLSDGNHHYINKNPWVQEFYLEDIWHKDLSGYQDSVDKYAIPRVMLKVLRGSRLRAWIDEDGEVVGTEKLVNVPLEDSTNTEIAFIYAALNNHCASFYLQKAIFSETTETARVMDGQYSMPIPIPSASSRLRRAVAQLAWSLTMAKQVEYDSNRDLADEVSQLQRALNSLIFGAYLNLRHEKLHSWAKTLLAECSVDTTQSLFSTFYTERFATPDGDPSQYWDDIVSSARKSAAIVSKWDIEKVHNSSEVRVVKDVL